MTSKWFVTLLACSLGWNCTLFIPKSTAPMRMDEWKASTRDTRRVVLMMPGLGNRAESFRKRGFFEMAESYRAHMPDTHWLALDAHIGYYRDRSLIERFDKDVLRVYKGRDLVLAGVSLGGFGACILAHLYPEQVGELVLIAPFLGPRSFIERIRGGGFNDRPGDGPKERAYLRNWRFLVRDSKHHRITVLIGKRDRFRKTIELLETLAPHIEVVWTEGGHNWQTWRKLWDLYLDRHCR